MLLYTAGRAMLWVVVFSSCISMYQYFHAFYQTMTGRTPSPGSAREIKHAA
ncbi:MAG: hypothetical protein WKF84_24120 [Pyrinomonadaceae bacterium]